MAKDITLLWGSGSPPCWRVMIALEEKNLQGYNQKLLSFEKGDHKSKEVLEINPRGQFPAFKWGDTSINESCAACFFLECQYKSQGTSLTPECPNERAVMLQRVFECNNIQQKIVDIILYNFRVPEEERHESAMKRYKEALTAELKLWEGYMEKRPGNFLAGKSFSLADVVVFPTTAFLFRLGLCEKRYPKLAEYYKSLKDRPSIKATWPPTWKETPGQDRLKDI